jgi:hypothetical protein
MYPMPCWKFNPELMAEDGPVGRLRGVACGRGCGLIFILQQLLQILYKTDHNYDGRPGHSDKE